MKYRIVNIDYWKGFAKQDWRIGPVIDKFMNDEVHILSDEVAQHGLAFGTITTALPDEFAMEEIGIIKCDICQKVCSSNFALAGHKRTHKKKSA